LFDWENYYLRHIATAEEAAKAIKSGDRVVLAHACGEPQTVPEAIVARAHELEQVEFLHRMGTGKGSYMQPGMEKHFRHNSLFAGANARKALIEGRADFTPCYISEIPSLFINGEYPIDVAIVTTTPPDKHGFVSLGVSIDYTMQAVNSAKIVIAEVNPNMPRTFGNSFVRVEDIDYFVPVETPIPEVNPAKIGAVEKQIGSLIASLIPDEATLQLGIGAIPDAVLNLLDDKHDLGIHTEVFSDGVMNLVEKGVITCRKKNLNPDRIISTFIMGSRRLYDWVDENPMISMHRENYVNDPNVIAQNDNLISINSALQVDLMGQVAADTLGPQQFSGVGGQVDFVRGAYRSKNGKSIIALPSTAAGGKISRIAVTLDLGATVTTNRHDVQYVVTEYGIAHLKHHTVRERMEALINIAHPDFRSELREQAKKVYYR